MRMDLGVSAAMLGVNGLTLLFGVVGVQNVTGDDMKKLQRQDVKKWAHSESDRPKKECFFLDPVIEQQRMRRCEEILR